MRYPVLFHLYLILVVCFGLTAPAVLLIRAAPASDLVVLAGILAFLIATAWLLNYGETP